MGTNTKTEKHLNSECELGVSNELKK